MMKLGILLALTTVSVPAFAETLYATTTDVTAQYANDPAPELVLDQTQDPPQSGKKVDLERLIALGEKAWDFIVTNKPTVEYETFKTSVVPEGITHWTQLTKWSKPVSKVYHVEFKNLFGRPAGGFDYRVSFTPGGSYKGMGKFIANVTIAPFNVRFKTDRSMKMKVELASVVNFGTEEDPIAGAQILLSWSSPTTASYEVQSAEFMIYGTGEIDNLTNGN